MIEEDEVTAADEAEERKTQQERAKTLLSCIRLPADLDKLQAANVTVECFDGLENYAEVYNYIVDKLTKGKVIHREDIKNLFHVSLGTGVADIMAYAEQVVSDYRERAVIKAVEQFPPEREKKGVTQAIRDLKNKLGYITLNMNHRVDVLVSGWFEEPDPLEWLVEDILPAKWPTFFYGHGGVAKSYLLLTMACHIAMGRTFMGRHTNKTNVLYLDWEMDSAEYHTRLANICRGFGFGDQRTNDRGKPEWDVPGLYYYNTKAPLKDKMADIYEMIAEWDIGLVIIDSFGYSMGEGKEIEKSGHALDYMRIVSGIPCSVAIIDHVSKMKEADGTPFGSVYKLNSCRWAWWLTAISNPEPEDNNDQEFEAGTYQKWKNTKHNMAARQKEFYTMFNWERLDDGRFSFTGRPLSEETAPPELVGPKKKKKDVIRPGGAAATISEFLGLNPEWFTCKQIAEATGLDIKSARGGCEELYNLGRIDRSEKSTGGRNAYIFRIRRNRENVSVEAVEIGEDWSKEL